LYLTQLIMRNLNSLIAVLALSLSPVLVACTADNDDATSDSSDDSTAAGKFDLWQASDAQWHFHLKSGNGSILLTSEAYSSRTAAINGVLSTTGNGIDPNQYQVVAAANGDVLHLVAGNNEIISFSQVYSTKSSATRAITSCVHAVTSYLDKRESITTGARVEVAQGASGQYHFNFDAANGQIVLSSESYTTEAAAFNGAMAVQTDGQDAANYTLLQNTAGGFYFTVTALNGQVISTSQQYTTKAAAQSAIKAVITLLPRISVL
jgi:uncharacterized protein YegP (UPF0339 family)